MSYLTITGSSFKLVFKNGNILVKTFHKNVKFRIYSDEISYEENDETIDYDLSKVASFEVQFFGNLVGAYYAT